jgi:hypothetical protein
MRIIFALFLLLNHAVSGQQFSSKTSSISIDYGRPVTTTLPSIRWLHPSLEVTNATEQWITISATVSSDVPLKDISIEWKNGPQSKTKLIPITQQLPTYSIEQKILLTDGANSITIQVENLQGGKVKNSRSVVSGEDALVDAIDFNRKDYALIIATDNYEDFDDLVNPIHDATTISSILKEKYGFETETLTNATYEEILTKITEYNVRKFNPQDQLFIFFAGHGIFDEVLSEGYVVASNSLKNDKGKSSYVSHLLLRERINNIKCEHIFLAMDVCYGGTIDPRLTKTRALAEESSDQQYMLKKLTKRTRKFLTSGGKEYVSDGVPGKHSPFAEKFILALKEVGGGPGRILSLVELQAYFLALTTEPRFGSFGTDDPVSDFLFVSR